jgi:GAF domain-containing protein
MVEDPVLAALVRTAAGATQASTTWISLIEGDTLRVVAAFGTLAPRIRGLSVPIGGSAGFVASSGQPLALAPRAGDSNINAGVLAAIGVVPSGLVTLPCLYDDDVVGVLELIDKDGAGRFDFADVEIAQLLTDVAGPALAARSETAVEIGPEELAAQLRALAATDPDRFGRVAWVITTLLT